MATSRTANQIIATALAVVGNQAITADAQVWLADFVDNMAVDYRWPFLETTASGAMAAGALTVALPVDFLDLWDRNSLKLEYEGDSYKVLDPIIADNYDQLVNPETTGPPEAALISLSAMVWKPYPVPTEAATWHLRYKKLPTRITDFDAVVTFPNDQLLTQAVIVKGLQYEDDDRYLHELAVLEVMIKRFKQGFNVSPKKGIPMRFSSRKFGTPQSFR